MTTALSRSRQKSPLDELVPDGLGDLSDEQTAIPRIARDPALTATIAGAVERVPTAHRLLLGDSRDLSKLESGSVHLVLTSPPYWTLKEYREASGQLGAVADYEHFVTELDRVMVGALLRRCWSERSTRRVQVSYSCRVTCSYVCEEVQLGTGMVSPWSATEAASAPQTVVQR